MSTTATTTAQNIVDATSQDIRKLLSNSGSDATILLDYVNRISLDMLRASRWQWLQSNPQRFITAMGVTDYWIGATGSNPAGSVDTRLNLTDVRSLQDNVVRDLTNKKTLARVREFPLEATTTQPDGTARPFRPIWFKHNVYENASLLTIYPAPDNQNTYTPAPLSPICGTTVSGALTARTYYVRISYLDSAGGESAASATATPIFIPTNSVLTVASPPNPVQVTTATGIIYTGYRVYASTTSGLESLQGGTNALGVAFQEPNSGLTTNLATYPTVNTLAPLGGYLIEFKYLKQRVPVTTLGQVLQVPDDYKDIVIAGVNWLAFDYLKTPQEAQSWYSVYRKGLVDIVRDRNSIPKGGDFIQGASGVYGPAVNYDGFNN